MKLDLRVMTGLGYHILHFVIAHVDEGLAVPRQDLIACNGHKQVDSFFIVKNIILFVLTWEQMAHRVSYAALLHLFDDSSDSIAGQELSANDFKAKKGGTGGGWTHQSGGGSHGILGTAVQDHVAGEAGPVYIWLP